MENNNNLSEESHEVSGELITKVVEVFVPRKWNEGGQPNNQWLPAENGQIGVYQLYNNNRPTQSYTTHISLDELVEKDMLKKGTVRLFLLDCDEAGFHWEIDMESYNLPE